MVSARYLRKGVDKITGKHHNKEEKNWIVNIGANQIAEKERLPDAAGTKHSNSKSAMSH